MLKVMTVGGNDQTAQTRKSNIDWDGLGLELVCHAPDQEAAVQLCLQHRPDIIAFDADAPAAELTERLTSVNPKLRFVVLTVEDGLSELHSAADFVRADQKHRLPDELLARIFHENLPKMQENFMLNLISNPPENAVNLDAQLKRFQISCRGPVYVVALLAIQSLAVKENERLMPFLMRDILAKNMDAQGFPMLSYLDSHSRVNCVISIGSEEDADVIEQVLSSTLEHMKLVADVQAFAGIGPAVSSLYQLYESRNGALTALSYQCVLGETPVMHYKNMTRKDIAFYTQESIHGYLLKLFRENNLSEITKTIENHVTVLRSYGLNSQRQVERFLFEYVQNITNESLRMGVTLERFESYVPAVVSLMQSDSSACLEEVLKLTDQILKCISVRRTGESNHLLNVAKDYIHEHFADENLCLESVSDHVGLSRIYFCKLFHQMEGVSFSVYLKQVRIEKAKQLLLTTNMKIFEVSNAVGFSHAKYFGAVFKQTVGQTPVEFQRLARE